WHQDGRGRAAFPGRPGGVRGVRKRTSLTPYAPIHLGRQSSFPSVRFPTGDRANRAARPRPWPPQRASLCKAPSGPSLLADAVQRLAPAQEELAVADRRRGDELVVE